MSSRFSSVSTLLRSRKLRKISIVPDGNCFYRAICMAYYKDMDMHHLLRRITIDQMMQDSDIYQELFECKEYMMRLMHTNKRLGVWNSDLADLVPIAVSKLLGCCIEVYSVSEEEVIRYRFGANYGSPIRLLHKDNHYDLLIKD